MFFGNRITPYISPMRRLLDTSRCRSPSSKKLSGYTTDWKRRLHMGLYSPQSDLFGARRTPPWGVLLWHAWPGFCLWAWGWGFPVRPGDIHYYQCQIVSQSESRKNILLTSSALVCNSERHLPLADTCHINSSCLPVLNLLQCFNESIRFVLVIESEHLECTAVLANDRCQ